jgi:hypothetical protein
VGKMNFKDKKYSRNYDKYITSGINATRIMSEKRLLNKAKINECVDKLLEIIK